MPKLEAFDDIDLDSLIQENKEGQASSNNKKNKKSTASSPVIANLDSFLAGQKNDELVALQQQLKDAHKKIKSLEQSGANNSDEECKLRKEIEALEAKQKLLDDSLGYQEYTLPDGSIVPLYLRSIPTEKISVLEVNRREQDLLDLISVWDIYESIKQEGQKEPGFITDINGKLELISGSRRLYCLTQLNREYLGWVGSIPLDEADKLSDIENKQKTISFIEMARRYSKVIKDDAGWEEFDISKGQISRYKMAAKLPDEVIKAYPNVSDITPSMIGWFQSKIGKANNPVTKRSSEQAKNNIKQHKDNLKVITKTANKWLAHREAWIRDPSDVESYATAEEVFDSFKKALRKPGERKDPTFYKSETGGVEIKINASNGNVPGLMNLKVTDQAIQDKIIKLLTKEYKLERMDA